MDSVKEMRLGIETYTYMYIVLYFCLIPGLTKLISGVPPADDSVLIVFMSESISFNQLTDKYTFVFEETTCFLFIIVMSMLSC